MYIYFERPGVESSVVYHQREVILGSTRPLPFASTFVGGAYNVLHA
jgi:hypothetical protein